jgi:hypothetical protein
VTILYSVTPERLRVAMTGGIGRSRVPASGFCERLDAPGGLATAARAARNASAIVQLFCDGAPIGAAAAGFTPRDTQTLARRFDEPGALELDIDPDRLADWERGPVLAVAAATSALVSWGSQLVPFLRRATDRELALLIVLYPQLWDTLPL